MIAALVALVLLLAAPALAQVQQPGFTCQNHGTTLNFAPILNCGTGTTCSWSAPGICTVTSAGGGGTVTQINTTLPITGGPITTTGTIGINTFGASGASHARGAVPDPGAVAGTTKFLREDATWQTPPGGVTGSGASPQVTVWSGASTLTGFAGFEFVSPALTLPAVGTIATDATKGVVGFNQPKYVEVTMSGASVNNAGLFSGNPSAFTIHTLNENFNSLTFWNDTSGIANAVSVYASGTKAGTGPKLDLYFGNGVGGSTPYFSFTGKPSFVFGPSSTATGAGSVLLNIGTAAYGSTLANSLSVVKGADMLQSDFLLFLHKEDQSALLNLNSTDHVTGAIITACQSDTSLTCGTGVTRGIVSLDAQDSGGITTVTIVSPNQAGGGAVRLAAWGSGSGQSTSLQFFAPGGGANIRWKAGDNPGTNYDLGFTWPVAFPTVSGQALVSTTAGVTSWATVPSIVFAPPGLRLSAATGVCVTTSDVSSTGTIFYTPCSSGTLYTYTGSVWRVSTISEINLSLTATSGKNYDVFVACSSATSCSLSLSSAWTNDTTRADALGTQDGVPVLSSDHTKLHIGAIRASGTNVTVDTAGGTTTQVGGKRFVWNRYNRADREARVIDTTDSWSYTTNTWRVADGATSPSNCIEYIVGENDQTITGTVLGNWEGGANSAVAAKVGIGIDGSNPAQLQGEGFYNNAAAGQVLLMPLTGNYKGRPGLGYRVPCWMEKGADVFSVFFGDDGADGSQSGMTVTLWN